MSHDPLLQPCRLRDLELKNRIISTAHEPAYSVDDLPRERYVAYHEEKARGGAMTMIGGSTLVSRDSPSAFGNLDATRAEIIPCFRGLADAVASRNINAALLDTLRLCTAF